LLYRERKRLCPGCFRPYKDCLCRPKHFEGDALYYALPYDRYGGPVSRSMVLNAKHRRQREILDFLGDEMLAVLSEREPTGEPFLLTYVPRSPKREMKSDLDPAEELAKTIGDRLGIPVMTLLAHHAYRRAQKTLSGEARAEASKNRYYLVEEARPLLPGRTVLLIDDVITTGATVSACTAVLKAGGAKRVVCLAAAKDYRRSGEYLKEESYPHDYEIPEARKGEEDYGKTNRY
jgi:predicted amidophosphoribosyltransferase